MHLRMTPGTKLRGHLRMTDRPKEQSPMSQVAEKTETGPPKATQIKDAAFKWDDPLDLERRYLRRL